MPLHSFKWLASWDESNRIHYAVRPEYSCELHLDWFRDDVSRDGFTLAGDVKMGWVDPDNLFWLKKGIFTYGPVKRSRYTGSLRAGWPGNRIPVQSRFTAPVEKSTLAPTQCRIQWVPASFPGFKWPGRGVNHPPPSSAEVNERVDMCLCSPSGSLWPVLGWTVPFTSLFMHIYT